MTPLRSPPHCTHIPPFHTLQDIMKPLHDSITRLATLQARVKEGAPKPADYDETKIAPIRRLAILQVGGWRGQGGAGKERKRKRKRKNRKGRANGRDLKRDREKKRAGGGEGAPEPADYDETRIAPIRRLAILQVSMVGGEGREQGRLGGGGGAGVWNRGGKEEGKEAKPTGREETRGRRREVALTPGSQPFASDPPSGEEASLNRKGLGAGELLGRMVGFRVGQEEGLRV